jgi:uncharacterized Fe-S cluster protein YjdI
MAHYNSGPITCRCCKAEFVVTGTEKAFQLRRNPRWVLPDLCPRCRQAAQRLIPDDRVADTDDEWISNPA